MLWIAAGIVLGNVLTDVVRYAWAHRQYGWCWYMGHRSISANGVCASCHHYVFMDGVDDPGEARWFVTMWNA